MEQPISPDKGIKKGASFQSLCGNDKVSIIQNIGPQFGVHVAVLQKEGERYKHYGTDPKTNEALSDSAMYLKSAEGYEQDEYWGTVPKGESYIGITSEKGDLSDFWEAVRAEEIYRKNSSNPPKI